jgi:glycosyltransferase involved in cell wall biosynthesis
MELKYKFMNALLSEIIPIYKVEKYLPPCLHSVLNQTYTNIEIFHVND